MSNLINNCSLNLVLLQILLTRHKEATGLSDNIEEIYNNLYHPKILHLQVQKYTFTLLLKMTHKIT